MHERSVEIEPAAALEDALADIVDPGGSEGADAPFEPDGLFFDMAASPLAEPPGGRDPEDAGAAGAAAGRRSESA